MAPPPASQPSSLHSLNSSRQREVRRQHAALTHQQLAAFRAKAAVEVEAARHRAAAAVERAAAAASAALPAPAPLGQGHAAATEAYRSYQAKHEAAEQRRRQAEALAAQRHAAAVAERRAELGRIAAEVRFVGGA